MVEWKKLGEVCAFNRGRTITAKDAVDGDIPVIAGGQTPSYYHNESNREGESITVAGSGAYAGFVSYWNKPIFVSDAFTVDPSQSIKHKYLFQWLKMNQNRIFETQKGAGVPHVHGKDIANILIPIPSLEEQTRIVGILDTFTSAIDNLKEQIAQRRKQYEYYRDQLLDLEGKPGVEMKRLGESCLIRTGSKPAEILDKGRYYYINAGTTESGYVDKSNCDCDVVTTPSRGQGGIGFVGYQRNAFWLGPLCYQIRPIKKENFKSKFLYYYLSSNTEEILKYKSEGGTPAVNAVDLKKIIIPLPPLSEQQRIVSILDTFEASIRNLEQQLAQREKQYEYYRNKLLAF
ncbi:restriction endonuclease subunit S [Xylanibacter brevis]|uniref:restriction endonuclease subunit S n=1 Tax=Xylanibacter brevis TaxID=83231 RepID=UPI0005C5DF44|nr:restriction endonuclease subunit S [Xylanibacter brevis]